MKKLRAPLFEPLQPVAELEVHMGKFVLASLKLSATGPEGLSPVQHAVGYPDRRVLGKHAVDNLAGAGVRKWRGVGVYATFKRVVYLIA